MTQTVRVDFPRSEAKVKQLVSEHLKLKDQPLLLAVYFAPDRDEEDVFLLEVIKGFGADSIDPEQRLFEVTYGSSDAFKMEPGQQLHLVLTNRPETEVAFRDGWEGAREIRETVRQGKFRVLYEHPAAGNLMGVLRGE